MKEWKKPLVKVVVVEEDVIATSDVSQRQEISFDDGSYKDQSNGNIWGR